MVGGAVNPSLQATAEGGAQAAPAHAADSGAAPDTVQSLQHEIEVIKAKIAQEREKEMYEEENFIRLPVTKAERKAKRNVFTVSNVGDSLTSFGNSNFDGTQTVGGKRKKSSAGKHGGKGNSKKKFKKKKFH